jgi:hypothetical protein
VNNRYTSFQPANQQQNGLQQTIIGILTETRRGPDVLADFQEELPPTVLFHTNVQASTRLLKLVRDAIVEATGIEVLGRPRIVEWVQQTLFSFDPVLMDNSSRLISAYERTAFPEDKGERILVVNNSAHTDSGEIERKIAANAAAAFTNGDRESQSKRATSVAQRFTDERKYDGSPSSDLAAVIARYHDCRADYGLSEMEMRRFAHNLFSGDAKRFYDHNITVQSARTIEGVLDCITSHIIHSSQRNAITTELRSQSIAKEIRTGCDTKDALSNIYRRIEKLNPMCSPKCLGDRHKGTFLRRAVLSESWSTDACAQYTAKQNMSTLYQLLTAAIIQQQEIDEARQQAMQHTSDTVFVEEVLYGGRLRTNMIRDTSAMRGGAMRGGARRPFRRFDTKIDHPFVALSAARWDTLRMSVQRKMI